MPNHVHASEHIISIAVLRIAASQQNTIATFSRLKKQIPDLVNLSEADLLISETRPNEPMWHQIVRNIKSHEGSEGNYITEGYLESVPRVGYRVTEAGKVHLANLDN
jgi:hypothetical protein